MADPAGGSGEQDAPPSDTADGAQEAQRGEPGERERGGLDGRDAVRDRRQGTNRDRRVLGPPAGFGGSNDALAGYRTTSMGGRLYDHTGDVLAGTRSGRGIF